ncbi:MAG: hypothetical protein LBR41_01805 [Rickettsiales bacterium]|jgi:hypothetical protein|nr:hypothetical protein [Rickettsiales bacterium]
MQVDAEHLGSRANAHQACYYLGQNSVLPTSPKPPKGAGGSIIAGIVMVAAIAATPFTLGTSLVAATATAAATTTTIATAATAVTGGIALAAGTTAVASANSAANSGGTGGGSNTVEMNQWNYKMKVTTVLNDETLICTKTTMTQNCAKPRRPLFGDKYCGQWGDWEETSTEIQF